MRTIIPFVCIIVSIPERPASQKSLRGLTRVPYQASAEGETPYVALTTQILPQKREFRKLDVSYCLLIT